MIVEALVAGVAAGIVSGLFGVGGGIVFVPALVLIYDVGHVEAEATSLLAIIPVALVGAWRQHGYGNVHLREGLAVGLLAAGGALGGVVLANSLPERLIEVAFAGLVVLVAFQLAWDALRGEDEGG